MAATGAPADQIWSSQQAAATAAAELRWHRCFPGDGSQIRALRRWITALLPACTARDDTVTVAVELATNAVKFTASGQLDGCFAVEITCYRDVVRVAVTDGGAPTGPRVLEDLVMSDHGRGLLMVRALATRAGVCGDRYGRVVWADVAWGRGAPAQRLAPDAYEVIPLNWRLPVLPAGAARTG